MTACKEYNPKLFSIDPHKLAKNTAYKNGYLIGNKKFGYADIEPIEYILKNGIGRLGFKFKKNGIIVLYTSGGNIIYMSPNNSTEFETYKEAYDAYEKKKYTGYKHLIKTAKNVRNKYINFRTGVHDFFSKLIKEILTVTGYVRNATKAFVFTYKTVRDYPKLSVAVALTATFIYYQPEFMGNFIGHIFIYLFRFSLTFLKAITSYTIQVTYNIGLTILNSFANYAVSTVSSFTTAFYDTLSNDFNITDTERIKNLYEFTKAIPTIFFSELKGGSIIQKNKKYYNKYLKYKTKYLALK
jgi:hypothetical protein